MYTLYLYLIIRETTRQYSCCWWLFVGLAHRTSIQQPRRHQTCRVTAHHRRLSRLVSTHMFFACCLCRARGAVYDRFGGGSSFDGGAHYLTVLLLCVSLAGGGGGQATSQPARSSATTSAAKPFSVSRSPIAIVRTNTDRSVVRCALALWFKIAIYTLISICNIYD